MKDSPVLKRAAYRWAMRTRMRRLADLLVFRPLRWQLGLDRVRLAVCGAAPASPELFHFYRTIGVPLVEGYGQTESTGAIAIDRIEAAQPGTGGAALPGVGGKVVDDRGV